MLGVKPGWSINMIASTPVTESPMIGVLLQESKRRGKKYTVWFVKDEDTLRTEEAEELARKEREAKLPLRGPSDTRHLAMLREEFPFQTFIENPEDRAITVTQLSRVLRFARENCHRWRDMAGQSLSRTSGQVLDVSFLNLHHVNAWVIKPSTKEKNCSFVELVANGKQPASWFISHWWGERMQDFLKCVELHKESRRLQDFTRYWVWAYANRQHTATADAGEDPRKGMFYRAMEVADFKVLLILDQQGAHGGPSTPFSRLWCVFEALMCLETEAVPMDIAATHEGETHLITKDLTPEEEALDRQNPGAGRKAQIERERGFPLTIVEAALGLEVHRAQVSVSADRARILNFISGRDLNAAPVDEHEKYTEMSHRLRAFFAMCFWRRTMAEVSHPHKEALQGMVSYALGQDHWRQSLILSMEGLVDVGDEQIALLAQGLPPKLNKLKLDLRGIKVGNKCMAVLAQGLPQQLEILDLDLSRCPKLNDAGVAAFRNHIPASLKSLRISLDDTKVSNAVRDACDTLESLQLASLPDVAKLQERATQLANHAEAVQAEAKEAMVEAVPAMEAAKEVLSRLTPADLNELAAAKKAPPGCTEVIVCTSFLLNNDKKAIVWKACQTLLKMTDLASRLDNFDATNIPAQTLTNVEAILAKNEFKPDILKIKSVAAANLAEWVLNIVRYHKVYQGVAPLMNKLKEAQDAKASAEAELVATFGE